MVDKAMWCLSCRMCCCCVNLIPWGHRKVAGARAGAPCALPLPTRASATSFGMYAIRSDSRLSPPLSTFGLAACLHSLLRSACLLHPSPPALRLHFSPSSLCINLSHTLTHFPRTFSRAAFPIHFSRMLSRRLQLSSTVQFYVLLLAASLRKQAACRASALLVRAVAGDVALLLALVALAWANGAAATTAPTATEATGTATGRPAVRAVAREVARAAAAVARAAVDCRGAVARNVAVLAALVAVLRAHRGRLRRSRAVTAEVAGLAAVVARARRLGVRAVTGDVPLLSALETRSAAGHCSRVKLLFPLSLSLSSRTRKEEKNSRVRSAVGRKRDGAAHDAQWGGASEG